MLTKIPWFKAKTYGWGWQPASWQGWLVFLVWLVLDGVVLWGVYRIYGTSAGFGWITVLINGGFALGIILIAWATGEKPRWHWGKKPPTPPIV